VVVGAYIKQRKVGQDLGYPVVIVLLRVFDLAHVKLTDAHNRKVSVNNGWRFALGHRQDDIDEILRLRHNLYLLEIVDHHSSLSDSLHADRRL